MIPFNYLTKKTDVQHDKQHGAAHHDKGEHYQGKLMYFYQNVSNCRGQI